MARSYVKRNYSDELSTYKNQNIVDKKKIYNNIAATINARLNNFNGDASEVASDLMNEIKKLKKRNPGMFTKNGNLKRSADAKVIDKQYSKLVKVLYTIDEKGIPVTRKTAKEVRTQVKKEVSARNLDYIKHLQHKAKALGLEKELEQLVGTEAYKAANKKPSDPPEGADDIFEEEEEMNSNYEQLLEESGLNPDEWLDATTLGYIGHVYQKYQGKSIFKKLGGKTK